MKICYEKCFHFQRKKLVAMVTAAILDFLTRFSKFNSSLSFQGISLKIVENNFQYVCSKLYWRIFDIINTFWKMNFLMLHPLFFFIFDNFMILNCNNSKMKNYFKNPSIQFIGQRIKNMWVKFQGNLLENRWKIAKRKEKISILRKTLKSQEKLYR